jgi:hypothetical protein
MSTNFCRDLFGVNLIVSKFSVFMEYAHKSLFHSEAMRSNLD